MQKVTPKTSEYMEGPIEGGPSRKKKDKKIYPEFRLRHEFFPEAKKHEVGKMMEVTLKVKVVGLSISKFQNDTEFEIHGYEFGKESKGE